jgi:hypothetical protein
VSEPIVEIIGDHRSPEDMLKWIYQHISKGHNQAINIDYYLGRRGNWKGTHGTAWYGHRWTMFCECSEDGQNTKRTCVFETADDAMLFKLTWA